MIEGWGISCEIALIWMSLDFTNDQSTSVQVMAWCRQAISHYLNQCWPRSLSPYGITRPQWVKHCGQPSTDIGISDRLAINTVIWNTPWADKHGIYICMTRTFCQNAFHITWVRSQRYSCLATWFCYQMMAKPSNKTASPSWPDPHALLIIAQNLAASFSVNQKQSNS